MPRVTSGTYHLEVPDIGTFEVRRKTFRDRLAIEVEYSRLLGGVESPTIFLDFYAEAFATVKVLVVKAPEGFDVEELDPDEDASYRKLIAVKDAIIAKEADFRGKSGAGREEAGAAAGEVAGAVVPANVQPAAQ